MIIIIVGSKRSWWAGVHWSEEEQRNTNSDVNIWRISGDPQYVYELVYSWTTLVNYHSTFHQLDIPFYFGPDDRLPPKSYFVEPITANTCLSQHHQFHTTNPLVFLLSSRTSGRKATVPLFIGYLNCMPYTLLSDVTPNPYDPIPRLPTYSKLSYLPSPPTHLLVMIRGSMCLLNMQQLAQFFNKLTLKLPPLIWVQSIW